MYVLPEKREEQIITTSAADYISRENVNKHNGVCMINIEIRYRNRNEYLRNLRQAIQTLIVERVQLRRRKCRGERDTKSQKTFGSQSSPTNQAAGSSAQVPQSLSASPSFLDSTRNDHKITAIISKNLVKVLPPQHGTYAHYHDQETSGRSLHQANVPNPYFMPSLSIVNNPLLEQIPFPPALQLQNHLQNIGSEASHQIILMYSPSVLSPFMISCLFFRLILPFRCAQMYHLLQQLHEPTSFY